jgi:hypothetical protein
MRSRALLLLSVVTSIAALIVGVWALAQDPFTQRLRLPDGSLLSLEAVTYGSKHEFVYRTWLQKLLLLTPPPVGPSRNAFSSPPIVPPSALVLWFVYRGGTIDWNRTQVTIVDDQGDETPAFSHSWTLWPTNLNPDQHGYWEVEETALFQFPRRGTFFRVRYYDEAARTPFAEFLVRNPTPGSHATWMGERLPSKRRIGDLSIALTELTTEFQFGRGTPHRIPPRRTARSRHLPAPFMFGDRFLPGSRPALAVFRLTEQGQPSRRWEPLGGMVWDGTGNERWMWLGWDRRARVFVGNMGDGLWPDSSAWKLRLELARTPLAGFAPEETWTVRGVPVPRPGSVTQYVATATRQGVRLRLLGLVGKGTVRWPGQGYIACWVGEDPTVRLRVRSLPDTYHITLRAVDDRSRRYAGEDPRSGRYSAGYDPQQCTPAQGPGEQEFRYRLRLAPDAKTVDLTFAVHQSRFVEFLAHPSRS